MTKKDGRAGGEKVTPIARMNTAKQLADSLGKTVEALTWEDLTRGKDFGEILIDVREIPPHLRTKTENDAWETQGKAIRLPSGEVWDIND